MPDQTPEPTRKPAPFSDRELTEYANGTVTASNPYAAVQDLATELIDARGWARHGYEIGQRSCTWSDQGVAPAWLTDGHAPESLEPAEDQRRLFGLDEENAKLRARIAELEAAQSEPHAYIAVKRLHSPNATEPEWDAPARVIPAGDPHGVQGWYEREGYELLPIVGTETGTRPAAVPQADPAGYVVVTRNSEGGVHRSATVWDSLDQARVAEGVQAGYADGTGCTAAVYELREVRGA